MTASSIALLSSSSRRHPPRHAALWPLFTASALRFAALLSVLSDQLVRARGQEKMKDAATDRYAGIVSRNMSLSRATDLTAPATKEIIIFFAFFLV